MFEVIWNIFILSIFTEGGGGNPFSENSTNLSFSFEPFPKILNIAKKEALEKIYIMWVVWTLKSWMVWRLHIKTTILLQGLNQYCSHLVFVNFSASFRG